MWMKWYETWDDFLDRAARVRRDEIERARQEQTRRMEDRLDARDRQRRLTREIEAARREARRG